MEYFVTASCFCVLLDFSPFIEGNLKDSQSVCSDSLDRVADKYINFLQMADNNVTVPIRECFLC